MCNLPSSPPYERVAVWVYAWCLAPLSLTGLEKAVPLVLPLVSFHERHRRALVLVHVHLDLRPREPQHDYRGCIIVGLCIQERDVRGVLFPKIANTVPR